TPCSGQISTLLFFTRQTRRVSANDSCAAGRSRTHPYRQNPTRPRVRSLDRDNRRLEDGLRGLCASCSQKVSICCRLVVQAQCPTLATLLRPHVEKSGGRFLSFDAQLSHTSADGFLAGESSC